MAISANTLAQTASTLMSQLSGGTITFESYQSSMNSVIQSSMDNPDFENPDNGDAAHTVDIATRISQGEAPPVKRK
jgi:hypothetical protein